MNYCDTMSCSDNYSSGGDGGRTAGTSGIAQSSKNRPPWHYYHYETRSKS